MRGPQVVGAGEDGEEPGREPARLRGAVERAVIGQHLHPQPEDLAGRVGRDLAVHVVVAGERAAHQVLGAVLHPLHRGAGEHQADDRAQVPGVDADLVAEPAADVRRDDLDLVFGQPGDHRVDRAVRVRGLAGGVHGELAGHAVQAGQHAAGLHRRRVHPRVEQVDLRHHVGLGERRLGRGAVAGRPVDDVVAGAARNVVADQRRALGQRLPGVHQRRQRLVVHLDQAQRVTGGVVVLGDDERDLLPLEAHLVGGQHGLSVVRQRRHPGQPALGKHRAGDHRADLRVRLGGAGVHRRPPTRTATSAGCSPGSGCRSRGSASTPTRPPPGRPPPAGSGSLPGTPTWPCTNCAGASCTWWRHRRRRWTSAGTRPRCPPTAVPRRPARCGRLAAALARHPGGDAAAARTGRRRAAVPVPPPVYVTIWS